MIMSQRFPATLGSALTHRPIFRLLVLTERLVEQDRGKRQARKHW